MNLRVFFGTDSIASISGSRESWEYGTVNMFHTLSLGTPRIAKFREGSFCLTYANDDLLLHLEFKSNAYVKGEFFTNFGVQKL